MIDADVLKALTDIEPNVACLFSQGIAYVHSMQFVVELPESAGRKVKWPGKPFTHIASWRQQLPRITDTLKTTGMPGTARDGLDCMQLMALTASDSRFMQRGYYQFFKDQLDDPSFRILQYQAPPNEISAVGIYDGDKWVGVVGAYHVLSDGEG